MKTCVIPGCGKPFIARGWCHRHYKRWQLYGDPVAPNVVPPKPARCTVDHCDNPTKAIGLCSKHWTRRFRHGDPLAPPATQRGIVNSYQAAHTRLAAIRGKATELLCITCGRPAHQWAYDGLDPNERRDNSRDGSVWSADVMRYEPMCRSCHWRRDREHVARSGA